MSAAEATPGAMSGHDGRVPQIEVGPFLVADLTRSDLVQLLVQEALAPRTQALRAFALHVGGLNSRRRADFVHSMREADVVYADGGSVVWLSKLAGGRSVERAPTTDVGWDVLKGLSVELGRPPRVALIGGHPGLADRAGAVLEGAGVAQVVFTAHGYQDDWDAVLAAAHDARPDVSVIGLGAPREMVWTHEHQDRIAGSLVLTCGGWFGHLTGDERRAPRLLRRSGLEWIARLAQAPTRLGPRYAHGLVSTLVMSLATARGRRRRED